MVPSDYRLEQIAIRLIHRLEGSRRSYAGDPQRARAEFRRIAVQHIDAALGEYREVALEDTPEDHEAFVRQEILETLLPRYHRLATAMTASEERHFGLQQLAHPLGRVGLAIATVFLLMFLLRLPLGGVVWVLVPGALSLPFLPDITSAIARYRYQGSLRSILEDLAAIQDQAAHYVPATHLRVIEDTAMDTERASGAPTPPYPTEEIP